MSQLWRWFSLLQFALLYLGLFSVDVFFYMRCLVHTGWRLLNNGFFFSFLITLGTHLLVYSFTCLLTLGGCLFTCLFTYRFLEKKKKRKKNLNRGRLAYCVV